MALYTARGIQVISGYNNLTNWPSALNRPVYDSGANTLTFIAPTNSRSTPTLIPSTSSDVQQTVTLTNNNSPDLSNGGFNVGLNITVNLNIVNDNVTFKACRFSSSKNGAIIDADTHVNINFQDCLLDGQGASTDVFNGDCNMLRCNLTGAENGCNPQQVPTIVDCWIHDLANSGSGSPHIDGIQYQPIISPQNGTLFQHNAIYSWDTSCIQIQATTQNIAGNIQVINNLCALDTNHPLPDFLMLYDTKLSNTIAAGAVTFDQNQIQKGVQSLWFNYNGTGLPTWGSNFDYPSLNPLTRLQAFGA